MKIDLGGFKGQNAGFKAINITEPCDLKWDLNDFPWPFHDNSVEEVIMSQLLIHLKDPLKAMCEVYRICKNKSIIRIRVPHWKDTMFSDPWIYQVFKPKWFRKLCNLDIPAGGTMRREQWNAWTSFNFKLVKMWYTRGSIKLWKMHSLNVILEVVK